MKQIFSIVPAPHALFWILLLMVPVFAILIAFGYFAYSSRYAKFEVSPEGLVIAGAMYGRKIPAACLKAADARVVDLTTDEDYRLGARTNGVGLPGYKAGWFRIGNGEQALVFVTDQQRTVYVPTTEGYSVLVSVERPVEFLEALRESVQPEPSLPNGRE